MRLSKYVSPVLALFASFIFLQPVFASGLTIGSVTPATATSGVAVTFSANVSSSAGIKSCNLYVDLEDMGAMTISGSSASKSYTFNSGGSRIAFVFCKDNYGGMASGPNTAIWVEGTIVSAPPMSSQQPSETPPASDTPSSSQQLPPTARKLMKLACSDGATVDDPCKAVYYIGADGKRHAFANGKVFFTWYDNFDSVETVSLQVLSAFPLGKNVTYRPGVRMVKFQSLDKVYAVAKNGTLRWVGSEGLARSLYGDVWNKKIDDIPDTFYTDYTFGLDISSAADFDVSNETAQAPTFD